MHPHRPTTRVLAVLELLQARGRMSGAELAERLEIDGRTLRRYIVMLEELGIPITAERGRYGGYSLVAGFKLPPLIFNDDEALALSVGLLAARHLGLADAAPAVESAQAKIERVMPDALKRRVGAINNTVALDLPHATSTGNNAALIRLSSAAQERRRVHMRYASATQNVSERDFDSYGLAYQGGCWYAIGYCHLRHGLRSFRIDRVVDVRFLDSSFERPADFDAIRHLQVAVATLPRTHAIDVLLKTDLATARKALPPWLGVLDAVDEGVVLRAQADDLDWFARELAGFQFAFEIIGPKALRAAVVRCAKRLMAMVE
jgi:predicted DNA-binding transcriptional regulator YafY